MKRKIVLEKHKRSSSSLREKQMEEEEEDTSSSPSFWTDSGGQRRLRRSYSMFLSSSALAICILVIALAFTLVIIPTLHSFPTTIFKSHYSFRKTWDSLIFLLILFAILCAFLTKNNTDQSFSDTPHQYQQPDQSYNTLRSFNSYPDLRQDSPWLAANERCRFYDDTNVNGYRGFDLEEHRQHGTEEEEAGEEEIVFRNIQVVPPPPSAPAERESGENKNKRTSATKELLTSLKGKKKKQREASVENLKSIIPSSQPSSSVFHNMFSSSKKSKRKKLNSASSSPHVSLSKTKPAHGSVLATSIVSNKRKGYYASEENVVVTKGNESPLNPIPPPPPPPPFKMLPAWKFRVKGDFVRIDSISSSSSDSPDLEDEVVESPPSNEEGEEHEILVFYNPSPDVDTKAGTFIERFRTGLRMEEKQGIGTSNLRPSPKPKAGPSTI